MLLRATRNVEIAGRPVVLAFDLRALYAYESATVGDPAISPENPEGLRTLLWAMLQSDAPEIPERVVGEAGSDHVIAAMELITFSFSPAREGEKKEEGETDWFALWALGRFDLALSEDEFWRLTPRMFTALCLRLEAQREQEYYCAGITAAAVTNVHIDTTKAPLLEPAHFSPTRVGIEAWKKRERSTGASLQTKLESLAGMAGVMAIPR